MNIARPVLIKNAHDGIGMHFIDRHRDNGMPGSEACIVGPVFPRLGRLFADQPAPKAALMFGLTCSVFLVGRFVLGIALDGSGRYLGASATEDELKAATTISVMKSPCACFRLNARAYERP